MATRTALRVVATFPDMETAQATMSALEWKGVDALRISMEGTPAEAVEEHDQTLEHEKRFVERIPVRSGASAVVGASLGVTAGLIIALLPGLGLVLLPAAVAGGAGGALVGWIVSAESASQLSPSWEMFEPEPRPVEVVIASDEPRDIGQAAEVLRSKPAVLYVRVEEVGPERPYLDR